MTFIKWRAEYSVGINELDHHHRNLFSILNKLHEAMSKGDSNKVIEQVLRELTDYTNYHFTTEERFFEKYRYPERYKHKLEHQKFIEKLEDLINQYQSGRLGVSVKLLSFLREWLHSHILKSDQKYGPYLREKGMF